MSDHRLACRSPSSAKNAPRPRRRAVAALAAACLAQPCQLLPLLPVLIMLGLGQLGICAAARCRLAAPAARRARPQRRWQSTKQQAPEQAAKREGSGGPAVAEAEAAAEAAPPSMDSVLSMENLMKMAVGVPLLAPSLFFIGQGMEEKAFLGEVEAWTQQAEYKHSDAEHLAAKDCMRYVMAGQIGGLAVGGTVGWALAGLRAIPIALCAMLGGQVGAVYPTQLMTGK